MKHRGIKGIEGSAIDMSNAASKVFGKSKDKKKQADVSDIGITSMDSMPGHGGASRSVAGQGEKNLEDSFERYYNKDLDLDEGTLS